MSDVLVYSFGPGGTDGDASMRELLGGKGANLAEMTSLGIPVPPGFTITTQACLYTQAHDGAHPEGLAEQVKKALSRVEEEVGARFGDAENPLLVSVRSGAAISMPGMMDTVLNLGLNDATAGGLVRVTDDPRFVADSHRRFIQMFSNVVLGIEHALFEQSMEELKRSKGVSEDSALSEADLAELIERFRGIVREHHGKPFPEDPWDQLWAAVDAVFRSWGSRRAVHYRKINDIPDTLGTAVNVQAMVYGNMGDTSGTGVGFTRNPSNGTGELFGEWLANAQGEDVVAGIRTPGPLQKSGEYDGGPPSLETAMPEQYTQLVDISEKLEKHYREMQDLEFTVQRNKLWLLQTRNGKRSAAAAVRIAVDLCNEGIIDEDTALMRVRPDMLDQLLHPTLAADTDAEVLAQGLPASPGAASGKIVFTADLAEERAAAGEEVILVREETSPEDIHGMHAAQGILTARGGMTSHAAVVARGMGTCCVAGASELRIDRARGVIAARGHELKEGDVITLDGSRGLVYVGDVPREQASTSGEFDVLMGWADKRRRLGVRTNADTPNDARVARDFGAEGIGLCRTEHMFFEEDRIMAVREMILADNPEARRKALEKILPMQREDFEGIFRAMDGLPVTVRLLDPPLHEFLPNEAPEIEALARSMDVGRDALASRVARLREMNPMLGHRGCRLGITYPEIYEIQVQAIGEAAGTLSKEGVKVFPEIMIPLVATAREVEILREKVVAVMDAALASVGAELAYTVGTMIELPRACIAAEDIAAHAEFFSFGTNDLTQTTCGLSRDDAGRFLPDYVTTGVFRRDPFVSIDQNGVGELVKMGVERGRKGRPGIKIGICGEHGGEPASVGFCHRIGLDYVSCSPYRVPVARLSAAQAVVEEARALQGGESTS